MAVCIALGGGADVAALGVEDAQAGRRGTSARTRSSAAQPATRSLEEGDVDLDGDRLGAGRLDEAARERLDAMDVAREALRQRVGMRVDAEAQRRADERAPRPKAVEGVRPSASRRRRDAGSTAQAPREQRAALAVREVEDAEPEPRQAAEVVALQRPHEVEPSPPPRAVGASARSRRRWRRTSRAPAACAARGAAARPDAARIGDDAGR